MDDLTIGPGTRVTLHFSLALEDGTPIDSNFERDPVTFVVGDGSMLPGYEEALYGLKPGDRKTLLVGPEKGFGQHNPSNVQRMSRTAFDPEIELKEGLVLSFADANRTELPGVVLDFDDEEVTVDFNHPLAGHTITFDVAIHNVDPAVTH